jgi:hypothetical protein
MWRVSNVRLCVKLFLPTRSETSDGKRDNRTQKYIIFAVICFSEIVCFHTSQETHYLSATEGSQLMLCKIWGFHGGDYEECRLLGYKNQVRTLQETHYVSATESSRLMLCKIWGFHGSDYEGCRLLGYKNPVRTSPETHYVSVTEPNRLMLCKIWGFHGSDYEGCRLVGYKTLFVLHRRHIISLLQSPAS